MTNKRLDGIGRPCIMLKATAKAEGQKQGEDHTCEHGIALDVHCCFCQRSGFFPPDNCTCYVESCLWCVVEPVSLKYYPYCSLDCATASAIDDEVNR